MKRLGKDYWETCSTNIFFFSSDDVKVSRPVPPPATDQLTVPLPNRNLTVPLPNIKKNGNDDDEEEGGNSRRANNSPKPHNR